MNPISTKQLWFYPLIFGFLGALIGLILRYAFTGVFTGFPFKNVLHSHSHVMLLGFAFNALIIMLWSHFTTGIDKVSYQYYLALQACVGIMLVAFIIQGYAFVSIKFSTLHLWISYILLIRLWKQLKGNKSLILLIKLGIVFHFISSIGPYALGPLMVLNMNDSPWYQQAIFFYLHFQYFGSFLVWLLALLFQKVSISINKNHVFLVRVSVILLYAHSLNYSFNHWLINILGGIGAIILFATLFNFKNQFQNQENPFKIIYYIVVLLACITIIGSFPSVAILVEENRFILIAYLHFLFLGLYTPFVWLFLPQKLSSTLWLIYALVFLFSEVILIFPSTISNLFSTPVIWLLFIAYLGVFLCISIVHLKYLFKTST